MHDPPLIFNVEIDPAERDAGAKPPAGWLDEVHAGLAAHFDSFGGKYPTAQLDLIDYKCMDCTGLPANASGCCASEHGKCTARRREGTVGALLVGLEGGTPLAGSYFGEL